VVTLITKSWIPTDILVEPYTEFNRIEDNIGEVETLLSALTSYIAPYGGAPGARTVQWVLAKSELQSFESRLDAICQIVYPPYDPVTWVGLMRVDSAVLNKYEVLLNYLYLLGTLGGDSFKYSGTFYCGEDGEIY